MKDNKTRLRMSAMELTDRLWKIVSRMLPFSTALPEIIDLLRDLAKQRTSLDNKIVQAHTALKETSALLAELEDGLRERSEKLESIKTEYDQYSKLAEVEEGKAKALIQQIELTVAKGKGRERVISLLLNLIAGIVVFVLGVYLGPKLTRWLGIAIQ